MTKQAAEILKTKINWRKLEIAIGDLVKEDITFEVGIETRGHGVAYFTATTENLVDKCGIMAATFKEVKIENFSSWISGTNRVQIIIHFAYKHKDGGSNGSEICRAFYNYEECEKNEWLIR